MKREVSLEGRGMSGLFSLEWWERPELKQSFAGGTHGKESTCPWHLTPVLLPGKFHRLGACELHPWGCKELDTAKHLCTKTVKQRHRETKG